MEESFWKQELGTTDSRLLPLIKGQAENNDGDSFDAATFLYDLYKTSTVREIENFKEVLAGVQKSVLEREIKRQITGYQFVERPENEENQELIIQMVDDLIEVNSLLGEHEARFSQMDKFVKEKLQSVLLENIVKQKVHVNRLKNIKQSHQIVSQVR